MASVYPLSSSIDLTAPSTNIGTVTPPAIIVSTLFRSANTGDAPFVAQPSGVGAFQLQPTDSTAVGGNARGANAVDLTRVRNAASQVASGLRSFAANGGTAAGQDSFAVGTGAIANGVGSLAVGPSPTADGAFSVALGQNSLSSGYASTALSFGDTRGIAYSFALSSRPTGNAPNRFMLFMLVVGINTTDATSTKLASNVNPAGTDNQLIVPSDTSIFFTVRVTARVSNSNSSAWEIKGLIKKDATNASTAFIGTPTKTLIAQTAGAAAWDCSVIADTTNGALSVNAIGVAATAIRWGATITTSEVGF